MDKELLPYSVVEKFRSKYRESAHDIEMCCYQYLQESNIETAKVKCDMSRELKYNMSDLKEYSIQINIENGQTSTMFNIEAEKWKDISKKKWKVSGLYCVTPKNASLKDSLKYLLNYEVLHMKETYEERRKEHELKTIQKLFGKKTF